MCPELPTCLARSKGGFDMGMTAPRPASGPAGQAAPQASPVQRRTSFLNATTRTRAQLQDVTFLNPGDNKTQDVFATGFLAYLKIQIYGALVTGSTATGTFDANYWPYNLLSRLALRSNAGFEFYNTPGYDNLPIIMYHRLGLNPMVPVNPLSYNSGTSGARVAINQAPAAGSAVGLSTTSPSLVNYLIPVVSHPDLRAGLLPLQNNATRVTIYYTLGQYTDWAGAGAIIGTGGSLSLTARTQMEFFSIPADPSAMPDLSFIHRIITNRQIWTTAGDQPSRVPVNGVILREWWDWHNGLVPAAWFSTASDPRTQNLNNISITYAASQAPEVYDFKFSQFQHRWDYGQDLPNGLMMLDFASGGGSIEMGASARDAYNTRKLTEYKAIVNWGGAAPAANSFIDITRQELQPRSN